MQTASGFMLRYDYEPVTYLLIYRFEILVTYECLYIFVVVLPLSLYCRTLHLDISVRLDILIPAG